MTCQSIKYCHGLPIAMLASTIGSVIPLTTYVTLSRLDVTFTVRILATTCSMAVGDGAAGGAVTVYIGNADHKITLDNPINEQNSAVASGPAIAAFNIKAGDCPTSLQSTKTAITGTQNGSKILVPSSANDGGAKGVGVKIARTNTSDQPFTTFTGMTASTNGSEVILWDTASEVGGGKQLDLITHLVPISTATAGLTTGKFNAVAAFNFNYEQFQR